MKYIGKLIAVGTLAVTLAACGEGVKSDGGPTSGKPGSSTQHEAGPKTGLDPDAAADPRHETPTCDALTAEQVESITGLAIIAIDDEGLTDREPDECTYVVSEEPTVQFSVSRSEYEYADWSDYGLHAGTEHLTDPEAVSLGGEHALKLVENLDEGVTHTVTYTVLPRPYAGYVIQMVWLKDSKAGTKVSDQVLRKLTKTAVDKL